MLRVPEPLPGVDIPPASHDDTAPWTAHIGGHALPIGEFSDGPDGFAFLPDGDPAPDREDPEARARRDRAAMLDDAVVRNALTDLHERGEWFAAELGDVNGPDAADIVVKARAFLRDQERDILSRFSTGSQKQRFAPCFAAYAQGFLAKAEALRDVKIRRYRIETAERQNAAFLAIALRPENILNDALQTRLRDMYLLNIDDLLADVSEGERRSRLDEAHREFCRAVLDKRLELDPSRMGALLGAPAVARVLGDELAGQYRRLATAAIRDDALRETARIWSAEGLSPAEARARAAAELPDADERRTALTHYRRFHDRAGGEAARRFAAELGEAWNRTFSGGDAETFLAMLARSDPDLAACLRGMADERFAGGGFAPDPDYALFLRLTDSPGEALRKLRRRPDFLRVMRELGGWPAAPFQACLRAALGEGTAEDKRLVEDLRLARRALLQEIGETVSDSERATFFVDFVEALRLRRAKEGTVELDVTEKYRLAVAIAGQMRFAGKETEGDEENGIAIGTDPTDAVPVEDYRSYLARVPQWSLSMARCKTSYTL